MSKFVVNRLRAKPVEYTVRISHFVAAGEWQMAIEIEDIGPMDLENKKRIAADLQLAAELILE